MQAEGRVDPRRQVEGRDLDRAVDRLAGEELGVLGRVKHRLDGHKPTSGALRYSVLSNACPVRHSQAGAHEHCRAGPQAKGARGLGCALRELSPSVEAVGQGWAPRLFPYATELVGLDIYRMSIG